MSNDVIGGGVSCGVIDPSDWLLDQCLSFYLTCFVNPLFYLRVYSFIVFHIVFTHCVSP